MEISEYWQDIAAGVVLANFDVGVFVAGLGGTQFVDELGLSVDPKFVINFLATGWFFLTILGGVLLLIGNAFIGGVAGKVTTP